MTAPVDVSLHARTRWLQRVDSETEYPAESVREAFSEAVTDNSRYHDHPELDVMFVAEEQDGRRIVITLYGGRR